MPQNFQNHAKYVPIFHFVILPILLLNIAWAIYHLIKLPSADSVVALLVACALFILPFCLRIFALKVQDRVIRLEMQLRLQNLLPVAQRPSIPQFTVNQLVALRFAGDAELPALASKVLAENIADRKSIKKLIQNWLPDDLRA
jgi:hypothetical protein